MHNIVEKHFSISIAAVRSRGGSLVNNNIYVQKGICNTELLI
jgi:hypothetical protein